MSQNSKLLPKLPILLLFLGGLLRILGTGSSAIWYDESITLFRSTIPFTALMSNRTDLSGGILLELILRPLLALSHSLWILRLPSLLASLVSLWLVWKIMAFFKFSLTQQIIACALVAFLPGLIWIGQDARAYSLLACLALAAFWFALQGKWPGLTAACGLMIYCHSTGPAFAVACLGVAVYLYPWKLKRILLCGPWIALAWIPAILRICWISGIIEARQPWAPHLTLGWFLRSIVQAFWTNMANNSGLAILGMVTFVLTILLIFNTTRSRERTLLAAAWLMPLAALILVCLAWTNVIMYRTLMPLLFPFALWLGWELGDLSTQRAFKQVVLSAWTITLLFAVITWNPAARGAYLDRAAATIRSAWQPGDVLFYATATVARPFDYYLHDLPHVLWQGTSSPFMLEPDANFPDTGRVDASKRVWVIIPREILITASEYKELDRLFPHSAPELTISYLQAASIDVFFGGETIMYIFNYTGIHVTIDNEYGGITFQVGKVGAEFARRLVEQANQAAQQPETHPCLSYGAPRTLHGSVLAECPNCGECETDITLSEESAP